MLEGTPRTLVDLSNYIDTCGKIGMLTTLNWHYVLPGDGYASTIAGRLQFSPLRRYIVKDAKIDIVSFYTPMRFIYNNWTDFIEQGSDETVTLATDFGEHGSSSNIEGWIGCKHHGSSAGKGWPAWLQNDIPKIWTHYFRPPGTIAEPTTWNDFFAKAGIDGSANQGWGPGTAMLKTVWNTFAKDNITSSDRDVAVQSNKWSLFALDQQMAHLRTEQERDFFMTRYRDIISNMGGHAPIDADERPELIGRSSFWSSGYDVDGTDQTSLGQFTGRMSIAFMHSIPRKFIPEHGIIRHVAVVRFPPIVETETDYIAHIPQPTYRDNAGDPDLIRNQPPMAYKPNEWFTDTSNSTKAGVIPFGNHLRHKANFVHPKYAELQGFPFIKTAPVNSSSKIHNQLIHKHDLYDDMFQTQQLGHWQISAKCTTPVVRRIPTARESLLAGT